MLLQVLLKKHPKEEASSSATQSSSEAGLGKEGSGEIGESTSSVFPSGFCLSLFYVILALKCMKYVLFWVALNFRY